MANAAIPAHMLAVARAQMRRLLSDPEDPEDDKPTANIYRPNPVTGRLPTTPLYANLPVEVEPVARLALPENAPPEDQALMPVRFDIRMDIGTDVQARDVVEVGTTRYAVMGVRGGTTYGLFVFLDAERAA